MTTTHELSSMNTDELLALQAAVQARLTEIREQIMVQAEALGLSCSPDNGAKPRKKRNSKQPDAS